jgi:hypothetical protein
VTGIPTDYLRDAAAREKAFWVNSRELLERLRKFIAIRLDQHVLADSAELARQALRSLTTFSKIEDREAGTAHLWNIHRIVVEVMKESKLLEVALAEAIEKPTPSSFQRLDTVLTLFEKLEEEKLAVIAEQVNALDREIEHIGR